MPTAARETTRSELLSAELLAKLERLELITRKVFRGQLKGERRSRRRGQSVEFADFRSYVPGDDLRFIDWNLYARLDRLFLKLYLEEEELHLHLLIDCSRSMGFGDPTKLLVAKQLAAALGFIGLCRSDRVCAAGFGPPTRGAPIVRGRASLWRLLQYLDQLPGDQNIRLADGVRDYMVRAPGSGIAVLLTDLMDKSGYEPALRMLLGRRMDVYLLHLLSPEELEPPLQGDLQLVDCEDSDEAAVTITAPLLEQYRQTLQAFIGQARSFCARRGITYMLVPTDRPVEIVLTQYLRERGLVR
jgi:uncharacterized protein (DUF58 family)